MKLKHTLLLICLLAGCEAAASRARGQSAAAPQLVPVAVAPEQQSQIDLAWKDVQIAQLELQMAVQQALAGLGKDAEYDASRRQFFRKVTPAAPPKTAAGGAAPKTEPGAKRN
jgi:hypothetical protein